MKSWIAAATIVLTAVPALAQWTPTDDVMIVEAKGDGAWAVTCQLQDRKGATVSREVRGGKKGWQRLTQLDARGGQCSYQAAPDRPLTIRMRGGLYACPLPTVSKGWCEQAVAAGGSGQFDIKRRDL
ncbi:hypothetical protein ACFSC3_17215 [Sphingomonas floccifaciens]|jgi:hypothetical protein|uniref:DUF3617 family protein n=2 Tax=Sphingomonas TaxID=13687 RepID=A0A916T9X1_9SPHN|nr:hypothetical protein [Sphingomonas metalli]GGB37385.1 hypothetical protein GCM10011380_28420 [Sphingomonas metalli]